MVISIFIFGVIIVVLGILFLTKPNLFKSNFWTENPFRKFFGINISHEDSLKFQGVAFIGIGVIMILFSL